MDILKKLLYLTLILITSTYTLIPCFGITLPFETTNFTQDQFIGKWDIQTIVTKSDCPYVLVGSTTKSNLEIKPKLGLINKLKIYSLRALWKGGNWTNSTGEIKLLNEKEAITERITELKTKDKNKWKAILIEHLEVAEENIIHSESIVIQYKNGFAVGEYKTFSILTKIE